MMPTQAVASATSDDASQRLTSKWLRLCVPVALWVVWAQAVATADNYVFDVLYFGNNTATLAPGSDDPDVTTLLAGDTYLWTIAAQNDAYWYVQSGGEFFPFMAFLAEPGADREADFSLQLLMDSVEVFQLTETGITNSFVHAGTNAVTLPAGLSFDEMRLDYLLISASSQSSGQPTGADLSGLLPLFGAPEFNSFAPGIIYVPEPAGLFLILCGLPLVNIVRR